MIKMNCLEEFIGESVVVVVVVAHITHVSSTLALRMFNENFPLFATEIDIFCKNMYIVCFTNKFQQEI